MVPVPRKLSRFIPATYFFIVLLPLLLVSLVWLNNLMNINVIQRQQVEQRFIDLHKRIVKHEVDHLLIKIDEIRIDTRNELVQRGEEYLVIAVQIIQALYKDNQGLLPKEKLRKIALDEMKPILTSQYFDSTLVLDHKANVLFRSQRIASDHPVNLKQDCVAAVLKRPGVAVICNVTTKDNYRYTFIVNYFGQLDLLMSVGVSDKQIEETAKNKVLNLVKDIHYGDDETGYLYVFQYDGLCLSHVSSDLIGKNLIGLKDHDGVEIVKQLLDVSQHGGGYVEYAWDRYEHGTPNNGVDDSTSYSNQLKPDTKMSYTMAYPDWEWAVGTGFYIDDVVELQPIQDDLVASMLKKTVLFGAFFIIALLVFTGWLVILSIKGFNNEISHFNEFFLRKTNEALPIKVNQLYFSEFKSLAISANAMLLSMQKAEQQLIDVFNCIDDVIYLSDPETYELLFVNAAFKRKFGENVVGEKCYKTLQGKDTPCEFCTNHLIFGVNFGNVHVWEFENIVDKRWYSIVDRSIQWHDGRYVRFEQARDVTEQKLAEIERESYRDKLERAVEFRTAELKAKTDQLEQANRDLEGFSYSVSHDLRSPLRAIDGFIAILRDEYGDSLDEEGLRLFSIVQNNAHKMGELIDDILAFSRAGRLELDKQDLDMAQLVKSVSQDVKQQYQESHIVVYYGDLPPVMADPGAIRQVLFNLINNAVKFSASEDPVVIEVEGEECDDYIRYSVKDNGIGFNNDYKDKLFVMFQRLHGMEEFEGTGVGLAIVKRFIQKHGGKVSAHGIQGEGATFSFELPFR